MTRLLGLGMILLYLTACANSSPVIRQCPGIPESWTVLDCNAPGQIVTNGDLLREYLAARGCLTKAEIQLGAIREAAMCREPKPE